MIRALTIDPGPSCSGVAELEVTPGIRRPPFGIRPLWAEDMDNDLVRRFAKRWAVGWLTVGEAPVLIVETLLTGVHATSGVDQIYSDRWGARFAEAFYVAHDDDEGDQEPKFFEVSAGDANAALIGGRTSRPPGTRRGVKCPGRDSAIRTRLVDAYGGPSKAFGLKCVTCKGKGWAGRGRPPCPVCGSTGWATPPGPLATEGKPWTGTHCYAALAVAFPVFEPGGLHDQKHPKWVRLLGMGHGRE